MCGKIESWYRRVNSNHRPLDPQSRTPVLRAATCLHYAPLFSVENQAIYDAALHMVAHGNTAIRRYLNAT
jgi:hypothetical protein